MNMRFRLLLILVLVAAIALLANRNVAWAGPGEKNEPVAQAVGANLPALDKPDPGSVKPPPAELTLCENGVRSVGGISTLTVKNLADGYCLVANLRNHAFAVGHIPEGAGSVLADITFLRVFFHGKPVSGLPEEDGESTLCYALPPGSTGQIYFLDFYGPRFGRPGKNDWVPLDTTVTDGAACTSAQSSGAYAIIGN